MLCKKCGVATLNGEQQCKVCGANLERGGLAIAAGRPHFATVHPRSRLAVTFLALSAAGVACEAASGLLVALAGRPAAGLTPAQWNLGVGGLALLGLGFVLLCIALVFGVLAALRLSRQTLLRGRELAWAGAAVWLCGAALFLMLRSNPHFHPATPSLRTPAMNAAPRKP